jgi:hypothetical protein
MPSRRVPAVDRVIKVTRDGDRPQRDAQARSRRERYGAAGAEQDSEDPGEGHVDIRV